jgi:site-specific DNA-methyltransferase (adenine-specific)
MGERALGWKFGAPSTPIRPRPRRTFGSDSRGTPPEVYAALDREFAFTLDPCPLDASATAGASLWGKDGLRADWTGQRVYCNPPYSNIAPWLAKAREAELSVFLLPVKTDLGWWHDHVMPHAAEVRLFMGRLRFVAMSGGAPFPSAVVVYRHDVDGPPRWSSIERPPRAAVLNGERG